MNVHVGSLDLTPMLRPERETLLDLLAALTVEQWERQTECPAWNVKGIALHVLGDDLSLLTRQRDASTDSLTMFARDHPGLSFRASLDGFNEQWVAASRFLSNSLVIELLRLVGEWSDDFYCDVGLDTTSREPVGFFAADGPSPYWRVIAREYAERFIHQSQIRRAVGAAELDGDLVTAAARVVVHTLAAWMRNYAPAVGASIAIEFGNAGAWTWRREPEHWSATEGADATPSARVTIAPARTVAILSRGISSAEVASAISIDGDEELARGALEVAAPLVARPPA